MSKPFLHRAKQTDSQHRCLFSACFHNRTITTVDVIDLPDMNCKGPYERLDAGADSVVVTCVPRGVAVVTVGENVRVNVPTLRIVSTSWQRVRANASLVPGLVMTLAAS